MIKTIKPAIVSVLLLLGLSHFAFSGGMTQAAVPTKIDLVPFPSGFMIFGAFGNAGGCSASDMVFVKDTHPQYKLIYSTVLTAMVTKAKIYFYAHTCEPVGWYSVLTYTYNTVTVGSTAIAP